MTYTYKGYNPANVKHVTKYVKEHYKRVEVTFSKDYYDQVLKPVCDDSGLSVATFIKKAVADAVDGITKK